MGLSKESIVAAALDLLNREGIDKLTMRSLAASLDTKAASLYRHIRDKGDLYDLIAEAVIAGIRPACGLSDPRAYLMETALLYRRQLLALRDSVEILTRSRTATPRRFEFLKNIMICLLQLGVKESKCLVAAHMFNNYVLSSAADELLFSSVPPEAPRAYEIILGTNFEWLSFDEQFACGLEVLFAGLAALR
jgi:TetR/AcrR family tetracycline transcriptional repressor